MTPATCSHCLTPCPIGMQVVTVNPWTGEHARKSTPLHDQADAAYVPASTNTSNAPVSQKHPGGRTRDAGRSSFPEFPCGVRK